MVLPEQPQLKLPAYRHAVILDSKGTKDIRNGTDRVYYRLKVSGSPDTVGHGGGVTVSQQDIPAHNHDGISTAKAE